MLYVSANWPTPHISVADDGTKLAVIVNYGDLYVWEMDPDQNLFGTKRADVKGCWSYVMPEDTSLVPQPGVEETSVSVVFFIEEVRMPLNML